MLSEAEVVKALRTGDTVRARVGKAEVVADVTVFPVGKGWFRVCMRAVMADKEPALQERSVRSLEEALNLAALWTGRWVPNTKAGWDYVGAHIQRPQILAPRPLMAVAAS